MSSKDLERICQNAQEDDESVPSKESEGAKVENEKEEETGKKPEDDPKHISRLPEMMPEPAKGLLLWLVDILLDVIRKQEVTMMSSQNIGLSLLSSLFVLSPLLNYLTLLFSGCNSACVDSHAYCTSARTSRDVR